MGLPTEEDYLAHREVKTVAEIVDMCARAAAKMGKGNPNKTLLLNCAFAMEQLVTRIDELERELKTAGRMVQ